MLSALRGKQDSHEAIIENQKNKHHQEFQDLKSEYDEESSRLKEEIQNLKDQVSDLKTQKDQHYESATSYRKKCESLSTEYATLQIECRGYQQQTEQLRE